MEGGCPVRSVGFWVRWNLSLPPSTAPYYLCRRGKLPNALDSSFIYLSQQVFVTWLLCGWSSLFFFLIYYLFLAVLCLCFCARAFSSCSKRGPLFIAVRGPLTMAASLVAEHRLQTRRLSSCGSRAQLLRGMWDLFVVAYRLLVAACRPLSCGMQT